MGKKFNQSIIRDDILIDFIEDSDESLIKNDDIIKNLDLLVDNNKAASISSTDDTFSPIYGTEIKYVCKYMCSLNKDIKRFIRGSIGGHKMFSNIAYIPKEYEDLTKYLLYPGVYYSVDKKENKGKYLVLYIKARSDDEWLIDWTLYFVGKKALERKNKFYEDMQKFIDTLPFSGIDRITYADGRPSTEAIFKSFDQMIIDGKDDIIKYIDNWKRNIPKYNEYGMIPKLSILLYGNPGGGKSTFCRALAKYLDIHNIKSLSPQYFDIDTKDNKPKTMYPEGCIYTIDDIDTVCQSRDADSSKDNNKIISTLLDFLDNPPSFYYKADDGRYYLVSIVCATTNYLNKLDKAVIRAGRFDLKIEMKMFNKKQAQDMCDLYGLRLEDIYKHEIKENTEFIPAEIQALCMENVDKKFKSI